jgi:hypothetical protein
VGRRGDPERQRGRWETEAGAVDQQELT